MRSMLYLMSMLCMASCGSVPVLPTPSSTPPSCTLSQPPPSWTVPSDCCSDFKWSDQMVEKAQLNAEWVLYDAELAFNNLPDATKNKNLANFTAARQAYITADEAFVQSVNGVIAAKGSDFSVALADLTAAVALWVASVDQWGTLSAGEGPAAYSEVKNRSQAISNRSK
jgi:hypothetical protein